MDNIQELKREITDTVNSKVKSFLNEIEPEVINHIIEKVEMKYIQQIYAQESEIAVLKDKITTLEEAMAWASHNEGGNVASEISSGTIKEISDTVSKNVLKEVRENLSQMKPQIVQEIAENVYAREHYRYNSTNHGNPDHSDSLERKFKELETRIEKIENSGEKDTYSDDNSKEKVPMFGFKYDGWVYYRNQDMGNCLYKIKTDGTCKTRLTDYSISDICDSDDMHVSEGYLYFQDADYNECKIKIDEKKNEKKDNSWWSMLGF